jgi:hypothetical protein
MGNKPTTGGRGTKGKENWEWVDLSKSSIKKLPVEVIHILLKNY